MMTHDMTHRDGHDMEMGATAIEQEHRGVLWSVTSLTRSNCRSLDETRHVRRVLKVSLSQSR